MKTQKHHITELLLQKAESLFAEKGYEGTAIRDIAARAEINTALIYYHFDSKEHLYKTIIERKLRQLNEMLQALPIAPGASIFEKLNAYVMAYIANIKANFYFHRILNNELLFFRNQFFKKTILQSIQTSMHIFREVIREGIDSKQFREVDPDLFLMTLFYLLDQIIGRSPLASELLDLEEIPEEKLTERIKTFICHQLYIPHH